MYGMTNLFLLKMVMIDKYLVFCVKNMTNTGLITSGPKQRGKNKHKSTHLFCILLHT